ncbi:MAG TPA: RNA 2',3'-cyclic phosphodiesterase, partial [Candidatus Polarisedimenticolaceae bacterium]|nr:RNA 2',3'-cyclic phosphodiesterase [Candidatus Polarisedimenticolaceae bacterium]
MNRLFLAIPVPPALRPAIVDVRASLALDPKAWRLVREDGLHATVKFLGGVDPPRAAACDPGWRSAARGVGAIPLVLGRVGAFPDLRRPRVLWIGLEDRGPGHPLTTLAERIERAACGFGFPPETRPYAAHVTLARARPESRAGPVAEVPARELGTFVADRLVLYRSDTGPGGARYVEQASYPLAP